MCQLESDGGFIFTNQRELACAYCRAACGIFSGTQTGEANDTKLGDIDWGSGINGASFLAALKADARFATSSANTDNIFKDATTAKDVAEALEGKSDAIAKAFANVAADYLTGTSTAIAADASSVPQSLFAGTE